MNGDGVLDGARAEAGGGVTVGVDLLGDEAGDERTDKKRPESVSDTIKRILQSLLLIVRYFTA